MKCLTRIFVLIALITFSIVPTSAQADELACGAVITKSVTLSSDLICPDNVTGLIVDGNNITLDLGAHTIEGPSTLPAYTSPGVWVSHGSKNVTIKNGIIDGFDWGVAADSVQNLTVENLVIRNQIVGHGFGAYLSEDVTVQDTSFFGPEVTVADPFVIGIQMDNVRGIDVQNVDIHGYNRGLAVSCWYGNCSGMANSGIIRNSNIFSNLGAISIDGANHLKVVGNHISDCSDLDVLGCGGLAIAYFGMVRNLKVENNTIHGMRWGIALNGVLNGGNFVTDSRFVGNHVVNNFGGIFIENGVTGNVFRSNILFDNLWYDLYHDDDSIGNDWIDNSCEFKVGDEIPDCP